MKIKDAIIKLINKEHLTQQESYQVFSNLFACENVPQIAAFLALLHANGETTVEILGALQAIEEHALKIKTQANCLDIVGTGGDGANTVNISTGAAILAAAMGIPVAKHGNRAASSLCGSADVLEAMGVNISLSPEQVEKCLAQLNIGFYFAPLFYPLLKTLKPIRSELGIPTIFNMLGPLLHPAHVEYLMIGVSKPQLLDKIADVVLAKKIKRGMIFCNQNIDELTTMGPSEIIIIHQNKKQYDILNPSEYGFAPCSLDDLKGGDPKENTTLLKAVFFENKRNALSDTLVLNAGVAAFVYGLTTSIAEGVALAQSTLDTNKSAKIIEDWIFLSNSFK